MAPSIAPAADTAARRRIRFPRTLLLTRGEMRSLLAMHRTLPAVESAFRAHGLGTAVMPPKMYLTLDRHAGDFRAMPSYLDGAAGFKWVNVHPENPARYGLPAVMAVYVLSDAVTALPLAIMDGTLLTAYRTGAAGGIASKYLAPSSPRTIGFIGCGAQARALLEAHRALYSGFNVLAADANPKAAERFAAEAGAVAVDAREAAGCDIVCTSTPSRRPVVMREWIRKGAHVNAMGADAKGKQELDPRILAEAKVVLDDLQQGTHSGEVNVPLSEGTFVLDQIHGTLGEIVAGRKKGREGREITVFDSTGLALQDLAVARSVYEEARRRGVGTEIDLFGIPGLPEKSA